MENDSNVVTFQELYKRRTDLDDVLNKLASIAFYKCRKANLVVDSNDRIDKIFNYRNYYVEFDSIVLVGMNLYGRIPDTSIKIPLSRMEDVDKWIKEKIQSIRSETKIKNKTAKILKRIKAKPCSTVRQLDYEKLSL